MPQQAQLLNIVRYPDPFLAQRAREVTADEIRAGSADGWNLVNLAERMRETMYAADGIGLAATQVGIGLRIFVLGLLDDQRENIKPAPENVKALFILNPVLSELRGSTVEEEGCLSVPEVRAKVKRFAELKLAGVDLKGRPFSFECKALMARACQHEVDHLIGILFIKKLGLAGRLKIRQQLAELEEEYARKAVK